MKKTLTALALAATIGLTACSHEDPLKSQPQEETMHFLKNASKYAEKKMSYKSPGKGDAYLYCMEGNLSKDPTFCSKFYGYMVEFAEQSGTPFKGLSVADLTDKQFFESTISRSSYSFNSIPFH